MKQVLTAAWVAAALTAAAAPAQAECCGYPQGYYIAPPTIAPYVQSSPMDVFTHDWHIAPQYDSRSNYVPPPTVYNPVQEGLGRAIGDYIWNGR